MPLTFRYAHMIDSMYKGIDEQGPYYEVNYLFDNWSDSDTAANELMGYAGRIGGTTYRFAPHQHPLSTNLYCHSARIQGMGQELTNSNGYPIYAGGFKVAATYRAWVSQGLISPFDDPEGLSQIEPTEPVLWCTQEIDFDQEVISVQNSTFKYGSDSKKIIGPATFSINLTTLRLTFHRLPYFPMTTIRSLRGKISNGVFLGAATRCVLFVGASTSRESYDAQGAFTQRVTMTFIERQYPWGTFFRPDTLTWDSVLDSFGNGPYQTADLTPLLNV